MTYSVSISIDAMGGALAPNCVVEAISVAQKLYKDVKFNVFGDSGVLSNLFAKYCINPSSCEIIHTTSVILDTDSPVRALRHLTDSSMRRAIESVKNGYADACISAGNTGVLFMMSRQILGTLKHIKRPVISGVFPNKKGKCVFLDMGANIEFNANSMFQSAVMGASFAKAVLGIENPKIGILNVGEEKGKGRSVESEVFDILKSSGLDFVGFVEGNDIAAGIADVVVTDGFSGNLVLKAIEGTARMILDMVKDTFKSTLLARLAAFLLRKQLRERFMQLDPNHNNGAMLIGINGIVVKSHGGANPSGFLNAIKVARSLAKDNVNSHIIEELEILESRGIGLDMLDKIKHTSAKIFGFDK
ncbi:Phosphate acyltransferase [Candidatus Cyrtobacter comes]|uniref:Phosphate acyltransferase n=1 Tax=Candidatus Cyrtobacter comes TaxID=675776 RepID=A0ABU5L8Z6_9RICK|nr:phosphate acyltransferase PlsX [Candidatus Cyrtobacter comes]MDZ5762597.1 Phosphate acyltransferase [Candidatus Cyrtobacter comes]